MKLKTLLFVLICMSIILTDTKAQNFFNKEKPFAHTFSIVARDPATGEMGVAVQSHWFSVGSIVTWGEAGVGVVATQSFVNPAFGPHGLALLKNGLTPEQAVKILTTNDKGRDVRQLAILDGTHKPANLQVQNVFPLQGASWVKISQFRQILWQMIKCGLQWQKHLERQKDRLLKEW